jgi:hypothetical protein
MNTNITKKISKFVDTLSNSSLSLYQIFIICKMYDTIYSKNKFCGSLITYTDVAVFMSLNQSDVVNIIKPLLGGTSKKSLIVESNCNGVIRIQLTENGKNICENLIDALPLYCSDVIETKNKIKNGLTKMEADNSEMSYLQISNFINDFLNIDSLLKFDVIRKHEIEKAAYSISYFKKLSSKSYIISPPKETQKNSPINQLIDAIFSILDSYNPNEADEILVNKIGDSLILEESCRKYINEICELEMKYKISFHDIFLIEGFDTTFSNFGVSLFINLKNKLKLFEESLENA